jgi:hypothetical protein
MQPSLTGNGAKVAIICNVTPASSQSEETWNTLRFADGAKRIKVRDGWQRHPHRHTPTPPPLTYAGVECEHTTRSSFIHAFSWQGGWVVCGTAARQAQASANVNKSC